MIYRIYLLTLSVNKYDNKKRPTNVGPELLSI